MAERIELQRALEAIDGVRKVYFQPPENVRMEYPCIRYKISRDNTNFANNGRYLNKVCYSLSIIDSRPDSPIVDDVRNLPYCRLTQVYAVDGLNHFVFEIFH